MNFFKNYFLCNQRMNRKSFFLITAPVILVTGLMFFFLIKDVFLLHVRELADLSHQHVEGKITQAEYDARAEEITSKMDTETPRMALFIIAIVSAIAMLPANVMRLKDLNFSPWLVSISIAFYVCQFIQAPPLVMMLVLIPNLVLGLILYFKRGTKGPNRYGRDPLDVLTVV
jgi:uncharacterized membrane protein YhaH (DUF805 family)